LIRTYNSRTVAVALKVPEKWLDNVMSHHEIPGVSRGTRGRERRVDHDGLLALEVVRMLNSDLSIPIASAVIIASAAVIHGNSPAWSYSTASGANLSFRFAEIEARLHAALVSAMESAAVVRRGRPPRE
jgi:hypothetical protein